MSDIVNDTEQICEEPLQSLSDSHDDSFKVLDRDELSATYGLWRKASAESTPVHISPLRQYFTGTKHAAILSLTDMDKHEERVQHDVIAAPIKNESEIGYAMLDQSEKIQKGEYANILSLDYIALANNRRTSIVKINLTSRCNLRCVYCTVGTENHIDLDIPPESLAKIMQFVRDMKPDEVQFGCFAETTVYPQWHKVVEEVLDYGIRVSIISNLARVLESDEVDVLSRCSFLQTSIDTIDCARQKLLRKNVDVRTILYNIQRVRGRALQTGRATPRIAWIHVPTVENISGLNDYVGCAIACGVSEISIHPVLNFAGSKEQLQDIVSLPLEQLKEVYSKLVEATDFAAKHGLTFAVAELELIKSRLSETAFNTSKYVRERGVLDAALGRVTFNTKKLTPGKTRLCLDPWNVAMVSASGDIYPCTVCGTPVGNLRDFDKLEDVLSSDSYIQWRLNLLNGTPGEACSNCPMATEGATEALTALVQRLPR